MSKKITSFLALMLMMFFSTSAWAQLDELQQKSVTIGTAVGEFETNTWYFLHQIRGGSGSYIPAGETPMSGGFMTDLGVGENIKKMNVTNVEDGSLATEKAGYLVRFFEVEDHEGAYRIQFGTGNWLTAPNGTGNSHTITTTTNMYDAGMYNIYAIDDAQPGYFALNVCDERGDYQELIDNNGVDQTIVTWGANQKTTVDGNSVWGIIEVQFDEFDAREALITELNKTVADYRSYVGKFTPGTDPGQYSAEALNAFKAALDAADEGEIGPDAIDEMSDEEIRALIDNIKATYEALVATKVPMRLDNGYYRIRTGLVYTTEITDEETMETTKVEVPKYMYSVINGSTIQGKWGSPDYECTALWKITSLEDGTFDIVNSATEARFNNVAQSTAVTMSVPGENMMAIEPVATVEDILYVNIRVSTQAADGYLYLHQGGHNSGAGTGGNLVGWCRSYSETDGAAGTEWYFEPVSEADALQMIEDYEPIKHREVMLAKYDSIKAEAKKNLDIAIDIQHVKLIKDASQLSSPCSDSEEGQHIEYLIDGKADTFWHSDWHGEYSGGTHYFQVEMPDEITAPITATFTRRDNSGNQITKWGIYGTNDPETPSEDECEFIMEWDTPFNSQTETLSSESFETGGNKYLRFYCLQQSKSDVFFHLAEFQLGYDVPNENAQVRFMGDLATNLQNVLEEQDSLKRDDIEVEHYEALKAAYDAFMVKFVDPTELRETLADVKGTADVIVVGENPGFWRADNGGAQFRSLYDAAVEYDAKGDYTPEQSKNYVEQLKSQKDEIFASANKIQTGKWYKIRFGTETYIEDGDEIEGEFDKYGWDKVAGNGNEKTPSLFGKYISIAYYLKDEDGYENIEDIDAEEVALGDNLRVIAEEDIQNEDNNLFRFIAVGDSAYMLQNKATGLFIRAAGTSGAVTLSVHPSLFNVEALGYGANALAARDINGDDQKFLHIQVTGNIVVTWGPDFTPYPGSRSGLFIEEAEDVAEDFDGTEFNIAMIPGEVRMFCFPMEVAVSESESDAQMWSINSLEGTKATLAKIEKAVAGRPFILVKGNRNEYVKEGATEMVLMKHTNEIGVIVPDTGAVIKGTFRGETVGTGVIIAEGNDLVISKKSDTWVGGNSAFIKPSEAYTDLDAEIEVIWDENAEDGIMEALANVSRSGAVYTIDGRIVSKKANLNDLSRFGKGIYILNGTKVVVK